MLPSSSIMLQSFTACAEALFVSVPLKERENRGWPVVVSGQISFRLTAAFGGALSPFPFQREGFTLIAVSLSLVVYGVTPRKFVAKSGDTSS